MAHICGEKLGANRHDPDHTVAARDDYQNLILLCPTHHTLIDRKENEPIFTVATLQEMKAAHEARVLERLDKDEFRTNVELARTILPLLEENKQSWAHYGPISELARNQPYNDAVHAVWMSERLSGIVPNNRKIVDLLAEHKRRFDAHEQEAIAAFLVHARGYERWVEDAIPYAAVKRFPVKFDQLIRRIAGGGE
jgi:hypothetical protein